MINVYRSKLNNTDLILAMDRCDDYYMAIKNCDSAKYDNKTWRWSICKAELEYLVMKLRIYNFVFEDEGLKRLALGHPDPQDEMDIRLDMRHKLYVSCNVGLPDRYFVSFQQSKKYGTLLRCVAGATYQNDGWVVDTAGMRTIMLSVRPYNIKPMDPNAQSAILKLLNGMREDTSWKIRVVKMNDIGITERYEYAGLMNVTDSYFRTVIGSYGEDVRQKDTDFFVVPIYILAQIVSEIGMTKFVFEDNDLMKYTQKLLYGESSEDVKKRLENIQLLYPHEFKVKPMPHQIEALNYGAQRDCILIGDEQGLGKTMESINLAVFRKHNNGIRKCLVVCGVNSTKYNWVDEIRTHSNEESVIFNQSNEEKKIKAIQAWKESDVFFGIINIEAIRYRRPAKEKNKWKLKSYLAGRIDAKDMPESRILAELMDVAEMVIFDEIHKAKNATSDQGLALQHLTAKYRIGLSGTPMTKSVTDLWNIMTWLGVEEQCYYAFLQQYCHIGGYGNVSVVGYKNLEYLNYILNRIMLRRKKEDVLNLPPKNYLCEYVELTSAAKKRYNEAKQGIIEKYISKTNGKLQIKSTDVVLTKILKLRRITSGVNIDSIEEISEKDNVKLKRIKEILDEEIISNGRKAIIFSNWEAVTAIYRERLKEYNPAYLVGGKESKNALQEVKKFQNDPSCKVFIGTIGAAGIGWTLTQASYVFFVDKAWNPSDNEQAEDRAHRIGTTSSVNVVSMVAVDTVDQKIEYILKEKRNLISAVVDGKGIMAAEEEKKALIKELLGME